MEMSTKARFAAISQQEVGRLLVLLVDSIKDYAIFLLDPKGFVLTWNEGARRFKGYEAEDIIGKHFSVFYTKPDLDSGKPAMELEVAGETGRFEDEGWRVRKDGSKFWANVIITAIKDETGKLLGFGKVTRDLTERKEAEMRYRLLVEGVTDYAIYSLDTLGNITSWNMGAQRIKGYSGSEIIGKHFSNFYTPEDRAAGMPEYVLRTALQQGHFEGEGWRVRKDGTRFWSSVVVTPIYDDENLLRGFSKVTRDISDRKRLIEEIQRHSADLEQEVKERTRANQELEAFSYSVSHDLRAPLRAVEGFATALREDFGAELPPEAIEYLDQICSASTRMSQLVQDLLNYSRISRADMQMLPISVADAAKTAVQELGEKTAKIKVDVPPNLRVMAHETTLVQALANLIGNAVKFKRPGVAAVVKVSAEVRDGLAHIAVSDNGIGIDAAYRTRIFKVFERLHGADEYPGTGIGLAIVQRGVERMGGKISVDSKVGEGSTFTVTLPVAADRIDK